MTNNAEETNNTMPHDSKMQKFILKVLFGPMFGCELNLPAEDYFFVLNPESMQHDSLVTEAEKQESHVAQYTHNTLYLPCGISSPNLRLSLKKPVESTPEKTYLLEIHDLSGVSQKTVLENKIFRHEHICFALKREGEEWSEEVQDFQRAPAESAATSFVNQIAELRQKKNWTLLAGSCVIFLLLTIAAAVIWHRYAVQHKQTMTLNEVIMSAPAPLTVVKGREGNSLFVLAQRYPEMEWLQEALFKNKTTIQATPVWLTKKKKDTLTQLAQSGYPVLQIDFSVPRTPLLAVYRDMSPEEQKKLVAETLRLIPFAQGVNLLVKDKLALLKEARQGLDRLHIFYRQVNTDRGYALIVRDSLSDQALISLHHFINDFHQRWGNNLISFSINLDENWLQNKSYLQSKEAYLFMNPLHWYFPYNKGEITNG